MKLKLNDNGKLFLKVILVMIVFYFVFFLIWNITGNQHKPSGLFWDWRREGYTANPLGDRKNIRD